MKKSNNVIRKKKIGPPFKIGKKKAAEPFALRLSEEITADLKAYAKEEGIKHEIAFMVAPRSRGPPTR
jgi:hypothetical protein